MKRNIIFRFLLLTACAFLVIFTLLYYDQKNFAGTKAAFKRSYETHPARPYKKYTFDFDPGQILDIVSDDTFILNAKNGKQLYWIDVKNKKTLLFRPNNMDGQNAMITAAWYNKSRLYVYNGNGRSLLKQENFPNEFNAPGAENIQYFSFAGSKAAPLDGNRMLLRKTDANGSDCRMAVYYPERDNHTEDKWLKKDVNCDCLNTDGTFAYGGNGSIFYVNYYNSRILKFDSSLKYFKEYATIDNRRSLPAVKFDSSTKTHRFYAPHRPVNAYAAADSNKLYVLSMASAANDLNSVFKNNTPLDVYSASNGAYAGSYHLEDVNINDVRDMKIKNGLVYLLMEDDRLLLYKFKENNYEHNK